MLFEKSRIGCNVFGTEPSLRELTRGTLRNPDHLKKLLSVVLKEGVARNNKIMKKKIKTAQREQYNRLIHKIGDLLWNFFAKLPELEKEDGKMFALVLNKAKFTVIFDHKEEKFGISVKDFAIIYSGFQPGFYPYFRSFSFGVEVPKDIETFENVELNVGGKIVLLEPESLDAGVKFTRAVSKVEEIDGIPVRVKSDLTASIPNNFFHRESNFTELVHNIKYSEDFTKILLGSQYDGNFALFVDEPEINFPTRAVVEKHQHYESTAPQGAFEYHVDLYQASKLFNFLLGDDLDVVFLRHVDPGRVSKIDFILTDNKKDKISLEVKTADGEHRAEVIESLPIGSMTELPHYVKLNLVANLQAIKKTGLKLPKEIDPAFISASLFQNDRRQAGEFQEESEGLSPDLS